MTPNTLEEAAQLVEQAGFNGIAETARRCAEQWRKDILIRDEAHADVLHLRQAIGEAAAQLEEAARP